MQNKETAGSVKHSPAAEVSEQPNDTIAAPDCNDGVSGSPDFEPVTDSADTRFETDKTDETYTITNCDFLAAIFGEGKTDTRPVIVSFNGNPSKINKGAWSGTAWNRGGDILSPDANNYFSLAVFHLENGEYRRRKKQFSALQAFMLDDVGTKVDMERVTLPPSWMIETSPNNFQVGYILAEPLQDVITADRLMDAIIIAGLCDAGAGGVSARLARLPVAVNGKHAPAFPCVLKEWNPDHRYTVDELVNGLQLDMHPAGRAKAKAKENPKSSANANPKAERPDAGEEIFIPRPDENAVIIALKARGLYKNPLGGGKHDVTCPWVAEHTDGVNGGTAYFEPDDNYPIGGFKCLHGHCTGRHVRALLQYLSVEVKAARMKPVIRCISGEIHRIADRAEQELSTPGKYYQRGCLIVTVTTDPGTKETSVKALSLPALTVALASTALWERFDGRIKEWARIDPPERIVSVLHNATDYRHLSVLNGIAHQPYLRPDGTLMQKAGYDTATGMYGIFNNKKFLIPENPTRQDAERGLELISALLSEFDFAQETDRAAALSAILTATVRPSLSVAPMYHYRAPQIGSGKSFLCQITGAFATPRHGAPTTFPHDDEECRKFLLSEFLRAPAVIEFDNLTGDLVAHKSLCTALTSEYVTGRILSASKTATVSTRTLFLSSGNNVGPVQDMVRRCITVNLDPACETPASRTFKNPQVLSDLHRERGKYVSAALMIIRAWIVAGRPKADCKALSGFEEWSDLCRQPLLWLGLPDPTESMFASMNDDPDRETLGRVLEAWQGCFGATAKMVRDVVKHTMDSANLSGSANELREVVSDIASDRNGINRLVLGRWIKRNSSRIVNERRFVAAGGSRSASAWKVESVSSVSSGSSRPEPKLSESSNQSSNVSGDENTSFADMPDVEVF